MGRGLVTSWAELFYCLVLFLLSNLFIFIYLYLWIFLLQSYPIGTNTDFWLSVLSSWFRFEFSILPLARGLFNFRRWQSFILSFALVLVKNKEHNLHISQLFGFDWYFLWGLTGMLEKEHWLFPGCVVPYFMYHAIKLTPCFKVFWSWVSELAFRTNVAHYVLL